MFGSILLPVDGSPYSDWARKVAAQLLAKGGNVQLLYVMDIVALEGTFLQDIAGAVGAEPFLNLSPKLERIMRERGQAILELQAKACTQEGIQATTRIETGIVATVIAQQAAGAEVVVIGRHGQHERFRGGLAGSTAETLLRKSPRPVLVVPAEPWPIKRVLLAFDGSKPALRALDLAARFCAARGTALTVHTVGPDDGPTHEVAAEARRFLAAPSYPVHYTRTAGHANEDILAAAKTHDLLVMGAHGHSRVVEFVLGSTTEYLLRNSPVATLFVR